MVTRVSEFVEFWAPLSNGAPVYMNGFQCNVTGATSTTPVAAGQVPVRCVDDSSKCVKGAKQPFYWDQAERNNVSRDCRGFP